MNALEIVLQFVAGKIDTITFENALYTNPELEELLCDPSVSWSKTYIADSAVNLYDYLIMLDYSQLESNVTAVGALEMFLQKKGIEYTKSESDEYSRLLSLKLEGQPKYLDLNSDFFKKYILPAERNMKKSELVKLIRQNCDKYFKYQTKPPRWIQNPEWIVKDEKPFLFIGQLALNAGLFHGEGAVYVFQNPESGEFETVKQFY